MAYRNQSSAIRLTRATLGIHSVYTVKFNVVGRGTRGSAACYVNAPKDVCAAAAAAVTDLEILENDVGLVRAAARYGNPANDNQVA